MAPAGLLRSIRAERGVQPSQPIRLTAFARHTARRSLHSGVGTDAVWRRRAPAWKTHQNQNWEYVRGEDRRAEAPLEAPWFLLAHLEAKARFLS